MKTASPILRCACLALTAILGLSAAVRADTLTGQVVGPNGVGVVGATLTFSNGATPLNPITGINGLFAVVLAAGTYDIGIDPPSGSGLAPMMVRGVVVSGVTNAGTIRLEPGYLITARVVTSGGLPVVNADTNVRDELTGERLFTPNDNTDINGDLQLVVRAGTFRLEIRPDPATLVAPDYIEGIVVQAATPLGVITLEPGYPLTGVLLDGRSATPLVDADLDVEDAITGRRLLTPDDNTDGQGAFSLIVPGGLYHVAFDPPAGLPLRGRRALNVAVGGPTSLGSTTLAAGIVLSGTVLDPSGAPVVGADLDVDASPGDERIYTSNDKTDASGIFSVVVPAGTFRISVEPPRALALVGARTAPVSVATNTTLPVFHLVGGVALSGTVNGFNGAPEESVDIDVIDPATGEELVTVGDDTDAAGQYAVVVPTGTWDVRFRPAKASPSQVDTVTGVAVAGATTLDRQLNLVPIFAYLDTPGIPTVGQGGPLPVLLAFMNATPSTQATVATLVVRDPLGQEVHLLPPVPLNLPSGAGTFTALLIGVPPVSPSLLGRQFRLELRFDDPVTGAEQDHDSFRFVIQ